MTATPRSGERTPRSWPVVVAAAALATAVLGSVRSRRKAARTDTAQAVAETPAVPPETAPAGHDRTLWWAAAAGIFAGMAVGLLLGGWPMALTAAAGFALALALTAVWPKTSAVLVIALGTAVAVIPMILVVTGRDARSLADASLTVARSAATEYRAAHGGSYAGLDASYLERQMPEVLHEHNVTGSSSGDPRAVYVQASQSVAYLCVAPGHRLHARCARGGGEDWRYSTGTTPTMTAAQIIAGHGTPWR